MKSKSDLILNPLSIEIPKKPANKSASEHRKITKPIMERRRRARINNSLNKLKSLILEALNKDPSRHSKLEKADILEMTVNYLQSIQPNQLKSTQRSPTRNSSPVDPIGKFRDGFNECATEITRYINNVNDVDMEMKQRVNNYLTSRVTMINTALNNPFYLQSPISPSGSVTSTTVKPSSSPLPMSDSNNNNIRVQLPMKNDLNNNVTEVKNTPSMFTFAFTAPHHSQQFHNNLHSPITPSTPSTPCYSNTIDLSLNLKSWKQEHLDDSRSVGSLSPGLSSVRSLSPVNETTNDMHSHQSNASSSNASCWRPW